jgi:hypothetical protein
VQIKDRTPLDGNGTALCGSTSRARGPGDRRVKNPPQSLQSGWTETARGLGGNRTRPALIFCDLERRQGLVVYHACNKRPPPKNT